MRDRYQNDPVLGLWLACIGASWVVIAGLYFLLRWITLNMAPLLGWHF